MVPLNDGPLVGSEDIAWFRDDPEAARGAATALARRIGLGDQRSAEVALAVAELVSNVRKHAPDGAILLRVVRTLDTAGLEVLVIDSGPGIADVDAAMRDGTSATGTLGIGLGTVDRLADVFQVHSRPGSGTVQLARFWPRSMPEKTRRREPDVAGITRAISGEVLCGDAWSARNDERVEDRLAGRAEDRAQDRIDQRRDEASSSGSGGNDSRGTRLRPAATTPLTATSASREPTANATGRPIPLRNPQPGPGPGVLVMLSDGLGHGSLASLASQAAVRAFSSSDTRLPDHAMREIDLALRGTRGAAIAIARIEPESSRLLFCGVGNISAYILDDDDKRIILPSHPGIVGHHMQLHVYEHPLPPHGALVLHSDGLSDRWKPSDIPGLLSQAPTIMAAHLLRHAGTRRDDASVVVANNLW